MPERSTRPPAHWGVVLGVLIVTCVAMLWIAGVGLRLTILAVPPLIRAIHDEMGLSETQVGILSGLPPVLFALAAVPGSLLIARLAR